MIQSPLTRRQFLKGLGALGGAYASQLPVFSFLTLLDMPPIIECEEGPTANGSFLFDRDNWKRHGIAHFVNQFWPGDAGSLAFPDDATPFSGHLPQNAPNDDPLDTSPGAYSACAINPFFDPYYTFEAQGGNFVLVALMDWWSRELECAPATFFHEAGWAQQIRINYGLQSNELAPLIEVWEGAWLLTMATTLGAAYNYKVTNDIGWPGPANHYYHGTEEGSHLSDWMCPVTSTSDGNLA